MEISKLPTWLLAVSLFLISIGFVVSLFFLNEQRSFAGMEFGPVRTDSLEDTVRLVVTSGIELPSTGGNGKTALCPENAYMIGARFQSDSGGTAGQISNIFPVCRTLELSIDNAPVSGSQ